MSATEYRGHNGLVRVEGEELVWRKGLRLTRAIGGGTEWRVPLAAIREVLFKDAKFVSGHLHLVLGDAVEPKNSMTGVSGSEWTIDFQPGKQAKAFRELHGIIARAVALNRQLGVDPSTARFPYVADQANNEPTDYEAQELVRQPSPDAPPSALIALAKQQPKAFSETWASLDSLESRLGDGEVVRLLAAAPLVTGFGLLVLTDRRVLIHRQDDLGSRHEELPLSVIESVSWKSGLVPAVVFRGGVHEIKVGVHETTAQAFIDGVGAEQREAATPAVDALDQLRKLGELRDAGVLTEEEFTAKKADLLGRI
ncbi:hypothetical protein CFH99_16680 [Nocardioides aromaticivorans]|uniref:SHOCT domain-containing protein n=1 Tax=Nocardioides aromaticivorans TaxID=200618 RepID=A0ABX7PMR6_9ACTN|nr:SHOCT domain-containing protein [Nocardioides aromaticivorans]QSR27258.1 hypothetical protein CFH99_16680 [Nocardioides aromaticivorans]